MINFIRDRIAIYRNKNLLEHFKKMGVNVHLIRLPDGRYIVSSLRDGKAVVRGVTYENPTVIHKNY